MKIRNIYSRLKGYKNEQRLSKVYKKHFLNDSNKRNTIILAATPKSGSTWIRFLFANIIALQEMDGKVIDFHALDKILPTEAWKDHMCKPWHYKTMPCIVKTHTPYKKIYRHFRKLFVYRNPLDTMVSQYHYLVTRTADPATPNAYTTWKSPESIRKKAKEWEDVGCSGYMRHSMGLDRWCHFFNNWINYCDVSCSYELLNRIPGTVFKRVINKLSLHVSDEIIEEAINRSDFRRIRALEEKTGKSTRMAQLSTKFTRNGRVGQWKNHFDKSDISYFKARMTHYGIDISRFEFGGVF